MDALTRLDRTALRANAVKALLMGHGLLNARVSGWAGASRAFGARVPAEFQVDLPEVSGLTAWRPGQDRPRAHRTRGHRGGPWAVGSGEADVLPGEKIRYL